MARRTSTRTHPESNDEVMKLKTSRRFTHSTHGNEPASCLLSFFEDGRTLGKSKCRSEICSKARRILKTCLLKTPRMMQQPGIGIEAVDIALRLTDYCLGAAQSEGLDQICSTGFAGGFAIAM